MPDFKEYVRENLPPLRRSGAREAEIVEELSLQFQELYERAIRNGLSVNDSVLNMRLVAQLSSFFGALAAFLACIGIYGVMSYGIARRTNEFGIRMALGAERYQVLSVVLWETLLLAIAGVAIGLGLSLASGRLIESLLVG